MSQKIMYTGPSPRGFSRIGNALRCLQLYAWNVDRKRKDAELEAQGKAVSKLSTRPPLAKGALIHLALAQHYAKMRAEQRGGDDHPDHWCDSIEAVHLISKLEGIEKFAQVSIEAYGAYIKNYPYEVEVQEMEIVAVEDLVSTKVAGRYLLTGRLDLAYRDLGGRLFVMDHKTTARLTNRHRIYYSMSGQLLGYAKMARDFYGELAGVKVNLIQHTTPKFLRIDLMRAPFLEANFDQSIVDIEESIERLEASGRPLDSWPKSMNELTCIHRYGECDFIDQCRHGGNAKKAGSWTFAVDEA